MATYPTYVERAEQNYAFIRYTVTMDEMAKPAIEGHGKLYAWLAENRIAPAGGSFLRFCRIDMARTLDVEAGIPVDRLRDDEGEICFGTLPGGRFVNLTHTGHYDQLYDVTAMLIGWAKERGVVWDSSMAADGEHWACRLEIYENDPADVPDPADWVTELMFKVAD